MLLAFSVLLTLIFQAQQTGALLVNVGLSALAAAWLLGLFTLRPAWRKSQRMMGIFLAGLIIIMAVLVIRATWYGFFTLTAALYAMRLIRWPWRLLPLAASGIMSARSQTYGIDYASPVGALIFLAVAAVNVGGIYLFAYFIWNSDVQSERRRRAVAELSEANRKLEATLAENAGLHAQLLTQAREAGALDERHRMAREIHDTLAQGLAGIITQLQAAEQAAQPAAWRKHVQAATALARESLSEARRSVHALRPEPLETAQLSNALASIAERWSALHGIPVHLATTGTARLMAQEAELTLLRTAQEALANVAKHAGAARVGLTLSYMEDEVALDVRDDGRGFDPARLCGGAGGDDAEAGPAGPLDGASRQAGGGFGLIAMRQRIEGLAGTLQVESEPGGGTAVSACVPAFPATPPAVPGPTGAGAWLTGLAVPVTPAGSGPATSAGWRA